MSNYATKKQLEHVAVIDTSDLPAKKGFVALRAEVDKLDTNALVNVSTVLNSSENKSRWFRCC